MRIHRIRLRKPWQYAATEDGAAWRRRFGRPARIESGERVWLVVEGLAGPGSVSLNDRLLGRLEPVGAADITRWDVTAALASRNELIVLLEDRAISADPSQPPGEVRLEIDKPA